MESVRLHTSKDSQRLLVKPGEVGKSVTFFDFYLLSLPFWFNSTFYFELMLIKKNNNNLFTAIWY